MPVLVDIPTGKRSTGDDILAELHFVAYEATWSGGEGPMVEDDAATLLREISARGWSAKLLSEQEPMSSWHTCFAHLSGCDP